ncbi:MAG: DUF4118 domain-containing protein [Pseudomonadota bacterium]|nr:DUF4118 domain-containing protein [Pseudomonadota bacterium]
MSVPAPVPHGTAPAGARARASSRSRPPGWALYALAVVFVLCATLLQYLVTPYVRPTPFLLFFGAVMAASRYGGPGPGMVAALLSSVIADVYFFTPRWRLSYAPVDLVSVAMFLLVCVLICGLSEDLRRARAAVETANRTLEMRVEARTRELVAAQRDLEMFSYSVAHDLRAPLRSIDGFAGILEEALGPDRPPELAHPLLRIRSSAGQMSQLIDDLLALGRVGRLPLLSTRVDVSRLAHELLEELPAAGSAARVRVEVDEGIEVQADPGMVRIALVNLLSNALKFSRHRERAEIRVEGLVKPGFTGFRVHDNGAGFDPAYAHKLFKPFERLHSQAEFEGNGVGLAIVKRVADRHGGRVEATGAVHGGATFTMWWPAMPGAVQAREPGVLTWQAPRPALTPDIPAP